MKSFIVLNPFSILKLSKSFVISLQSWKLLCHLTFFKNIVVTNVVVVVVTNFIVVVKNFVVTVASNFVLCQI
jgi:hypothetical protein